MFQRPRRYYAYLLRFWEECHPPAAPEWRFSLEDPHTGQRQGFACVEALLAHLQSQMEGTAPHDGRQGEEPRDEGDRGTGPDPTTDPARIEPRV